jgi:REP element-mobilizing transposase RayT
VDDELKCVCVEIQARYDINFLEIGTDKNHVHFLVQSVPKLSPTEIIRTIKSITAREIFRRCPEVKKKLWGGEFWSDGYYVSTVAQYATESAISNYVKKQGTEKEYKKIHSQQMTLFD